MRPRLQGADLPHDHGTMAILAQGTSWAVAVMQAFVWSVAAFL
jgi:hypothetical protein